MQQSADDYKAISERIRALRKEEHGDDALPPIALSSEADLDSWAKLYDLTRTYGESDEKLRGRIVKLIL